jgi:peptidyl-prolyl cis-trans isomerase C
MCVVALVFALAGCSEQEDEIAATVNGETISMTEVQRDIDQIKAQYTAQGQSVSDAQLASIGRDVLDNLVRQMVLVQEADEYGITVDDGEIQEQLDGVRGQFGSDKEYEEALGQSGFTEESLRERITTDLRIRRLIEDRVFDELPVESEKVRSFYDENLAAFIEEETVTARHILMQVGEDASDDQREKALAKIKDVQERLFAGADFAETAREYSEGPSGPQGGDLGTFTRGRMVKPFEDAAFSLEPGQMSDIVETQFGYHIILVTEKNEGGQAPFEEVESDIRRYLAQQASPDAVEEYIEQLVESADVELLVYAEVEAE